MTATPNSYLPRPSLPPRLSKHSQPVAVHDRFDIRLGVTPFSEQGWNLLQVSNRVQISGRLLAAESAIQIAADGRVPSVSGQLANVVDVIDHVFKTDDRT